MKVSEISKLDEKMCVAAIEALRVLVAPAGLSVDKMVAISESAKWLLDLAGKMSAEIKAQAKPIEPILPKEKIGIVKGKK